WPEGTRRFGSKHRRIGFIRILFASSTMGRCSRLNTKGNICMMRLMRKKSGLLERFGNRGVGDGVFLPCRRRGIFRRSRKRLCDGTFESERHETLLAGRFVLFISPRLAER